jgi:hypothetical protein
MRATTGKIGWAHAGLGAMVLAVVACASAAASSGREGNLGHGVFQYQCDTDQDPICPAGLKTMQGCDVTDNELIPAGTQCFPSEVATGARFRLQYQLNRDTTNVGNPVLKVVSADFMTGLGDGQFRASKPGTVGVYTQSTVDSTLVDYTLIKISAIQKLSIQEPATRRGVASPASLTKGLTTTYVLVAEDQNNQPLAGAIDTFTWETSDATIASLATDAHAASVQINALAAGKATITAYADDSKTIKASFDVTVQ